MTLHEAKNEIAIKYGYNGWRLGKNAMLTHISNEALINERLDEAAELYAESKVKNLSSNTLLADRLPNAEDVKRWYQLLVGKSEEAMKKDIEATFR